ncbi:hypothetical protein [Yinghuangia seranimata]|uniref:hypothetical protein n=1 Tax=Yinghuangia seranimata TaxID=408067 RepID=UPI00248C8FFD|nr:hypothetical protein [Yinghuangia seranimata]MDI2126017.1 hypothetical protein [Yinghuangia seranimata]
MPERESAPSSARQAVFRIGDDETWVALTRVEAGSWQVAADAGVFTADFQAWFSDDEALDFAERFLAMVDTPGRPWASLVVSEGRGNPLKISLYPVGDYCAPYVFLTPNGHDDAWSMSMELGPYPADELYLAAARLRDALD